jgi:hypothetical protein
MSRKFSVYLLVVFAFLVPIVASSSSVPTAYDRASEKAITGTVKAVVALPGPDGVIGVHLDVQTAEGMISVHLAPADFMGRNNMSFFMDDQVTIIGARVPFDGNVATWARAIQKGSAMLVLRNVDGTPGWTPATDGIDGCGVIHTPLPRGTER